MLTNVTSINLMKKENKKQKTPRASILYDSIYMKFENGCK